jgi:hypothetical protein
MRKIFTRGIIFQGHFFKDIPDWILTFCINVSCSLHGDKKKIFFFHFDVLQIYDYFLRLLSIQFINGQLLINHKYVFFSCQIISALSSSIFFQKKFLTRQLFSVTLYWFIIFSLTSMCVIAEKSTDCTDAFLINKCK